MAQVNRSALRKSLGVTEHVDPQGITPYVALYLGQDTCHVWRTGTIGFTVSSGFCPSLYDPEWVFVSYDHLQSCLKLLDTELVGIVKDPKTGGVVLFALDAPYDTELRVHTVSRAHAGFRTHNPGEPYLDVDSQWLRGLNTRALALVAPPCVQGNQLVLVTAQGFIAWELSQDAGLPSSPRESFLRALGGVENPEISLTTKGYYAVNLGSMRLYTGGHQTNVVAQVHTYPGDSSVDLPAQRLLTSLVSAKSLAGDTAPIQVTPKSGVTTKDRYGLVSRFSLGAVQPFPGFSVSSKTADMLVSVLEQGTRQAKADIIAVQAVLGHPGKFRLWVPGCAVTFSATPVIG